MTGNKHAFVINIHEIMVLPVLLVNLNGHVEPFTTNITLVTKKVTVTVLMMIVYNEIMFHVHVPCCVVHMLNAVSPKIWMFP